MVTQVVPSSPWKTMAEWLQILHTAHRGLHTTAGGGCVLKEGAAHGEPMLEHAPGRNCGPWGTHAGAVCSQRTAPWGKDPHWSSSWRTAAPKSSLFCSWQWLVTCLYLNAQAFSSDFLPLFCRSGGVREAWWASGCQPRLTHLIVKHRRNCKTGWEQLSLTPDFEKDFLGGASINSPQNKTKQKQTKIPVSRWGLVKTKPFLALVTD